MDYLAIIQAVVKYGPTIKDILDEAMTNEDIVSKITKISSPFSHILENIGSQFFPKVAPQFKIAAAVTASFDPNITKWVQGSLNQLVTPNPNLVVDGLYGPRTRAAVEALQTQAGLTVDGWAGQLTQAAIAKLLSSVK